LKFSRGSGRFDSGFGETEEVRFMTVNQVRECDRVERMKNGADVESLPGQDSIHCHLSPDRRIKQVRRS